MGSHHTRLKISNQTGTDLKTSVSCVDNFDWRGNDRPNQNFNGVTIKAKSSQERPETLKKGAKHCPFNMTLTFQDGTVDAFRLHQKHAVKCCIGFSHFTKCHDISVTKEGNLLTVTIKNTKEQLNNEKAEQLKKEGEAAMKQKQFEAAIKKYDEALSLANKSQTIDAIKSDKAAARNEQGRSSLQKGWDLENVTTEDKSQEAKNQFNKAQSMFEQAESLKHTSEQENNLKITKIKIEGNRLFNEANQLEMEAFKLFQEAKESKFLDGYATSQNKYKEVLDKYKAAKEKFDEGLKMKETKFDVCSQIASEHIKEILKVINDINKVELKQF